MLNWQHAHTHFYLFQGKKMGEDWKRREGMAGKEMKKGER